MKQVIELLERAKAELVILRYKGGWITPCKFIRAAFNYINEAIAFLRSPRWETPEQYEKRTGEKWPDDGAVYYRCYYIHGGVKSFLFANEWRVHVWGKIKPHMRKITVRKDGSVRKSIAPGYDTEVVCATEAGPPPAKWEPEEAGK